MTVTPSNFTIARLCQDYEAGLLVIERSYQRSPNWPVAAKSFLIDTILCGYPIPKLSLAQFTDMEARRTTHQIVDGQQRTMSIVEFYQGKLRISTRSSEFSGKKFDQLDPEFQERFLNYPVSVDVFTGATADDIREVFRRMNWYTAPLNAQEKRHARYAGEFKQFISLAAREHSQYLLETRTFGPSQYSRMADAAFLAECVYTYLKGIDHASERKIDKLYQEFDSEFPFREQVDQALTSAFQRMSHWPELNDSHLSRPYNMYSLITAVMSVVRPVEMQEGVAAVATLSDEAISQNLLKLNTALDLGQMSDSDFDLYVDACAKATNRKDPRRIRFEFFTSAITSGDFQTLSERLAPDDED